MVKKRPSIADIYLLSITVGESYIDNIKNINEEFCMNLGAYLVTRYKSASRGPPCQIFFSHFRLDLLTNIVNNSNIYMWTWFVSWDKIKRYNQDHSISDILLLYFFYRRDYYKLPPMLIITQFYQRCIRLKKFWSNYLNKIDIDKKCRFIYRLANTIMYIKYIDT